MTAHEGEACIYQRQMHGMPYEIIDQDRAAANPPCLIDKLPQLRWFQMVCEQIATHQVETVLAERQRHGISDNRAMTLSQVGREAIQIGNLQSDPTVRKLEPGRLRYLSQAGP